MHRAQFSAIADVLAHEYVAATTSDAQVAIHNVAGALAGYFATQNEGFDAQKFDKAFTDKIGALKTGVTA